MGPGQEGGEVERAGVVAGGLCHSGWLVPPVCDLAEAAFDDVAAVVLTVRTKAIERNAPPHPLP
jgi:hypothetical protein